VASIRPRCSANRLARRPPPSAPSRNATTATSEVTRDMRGGASAHELFDASRSPRASSREAKRRSSLLARGTRAKSKPKSLRILPLCHVSKGDSDAANSPSARSGLRLPGKRPSLLPQNASTSHTDSAEMPKRRRDRTYSSSSSLCPVSESSSKSRRQGTSCSAEYHRPTLAHPSIFAVLKTVAVIPGTKG
jgi:hypothetical protein